MSWTEAQWATLFDLLDNGWPGELEPKQADAYRVLLDRSDPARVWEAVNALAHAGDHHRFRPTPVEILGAVRRDPGRPTFEEAFQSIFGPRGVLRARPMVRRYLDEAERKRMHDEAALTRAATLHPLIGGFVARQGLDRLRHMPVDAPGTTDGPGEGHWARKELREAWDRHVDASDGRELAVLASGGRLGLRQLDPLAALGGRPTSAPALPAGTTTEEEGARVDHR
jgi:hypothetical protein